jgi:hypothetical protein
MGIGGEEVREAQELLEDEKSAFIWQGTRFEFKRQIDALAGDSVIEAGKLVSMLHGL